MTKCSSSRDIVNAALARRTDPGRWPSRETMMFGSMKQVQGFDGPDMAS